MTIVNARKKPVVIQAVQWTGDNLQEILEFVGRHPDFDNWFQDNAEYADFVRNDGNRFKIKTLEGTMYADAGDWVIRGVKGEFYPCKPDVFAETYEVVP